MRSLFFGKDDDGNEDKYYHAHHAAQDYSLCGMGNIEDAIDTEKRITCPDCIATIRHCKGFKSGTDYKHYNN